MKELSIPEKISLEPEIAPGIRRRDLPALLAMALPGLVVGIGFWAAFTSPMAKLIAIAAAIGYLFLCCVFVARIEGAQSILGYLTLLTRFFREQQRFCYKEEKEEIYYVSAEGSQAADGAGLP